MQPGNTETQHPKKAVILDRDGVINRQPPFVDGAGAANYVTKPGQFKLLPGVGEALARLTEAGILILVFTQQKAVARGYMSEGDLSAVHAEMQRQLGEHGADIAEGGIFHCPHLPEDNCDCAKPKPGMIHKALEGFGLTPEEVVVVGDTPRDFKSAKAAGCLFAGVLSDHRIWHEPMKALAEKEGFALVDRLPRLVDWILINNARLTG